MTEGEWLASTDPWSMLHVVRRAGPSERKVRLFNVAICRRFWDHLPTASQAILAESDHMADGLVRGHVHQELIDGFLQENPANLAPDELAIVSQWKNAVIGSFFIFKYLKQYTVFLDDREPPKAYGVIAVADPIQDLVGQNLPILTQAVLLPFKGKIIYDGLLSSFRVSFGPGVRKRLNETYKRVKVNGIITSLPLKE